MVKKDYIIAGQGIAGSVLALELIRRGKTVSLIDPGVNNATKVASGIINPITGRNYVKTWMADEIIPFAVNFFKKNEIKLNAAFFKEISVYKLFYSEGNKNDWSSRAGSKDYSAYLKSNKINTLDNNKVLNSHGSFEINNTYTLNTTIFLKSVKDYLIENDSYINAKINYDEIKFGNNEVNYKKQQASKIIFCEGHSALFNKYFDYLPFSPAKGECLHVEIKNYYNDRIINGNYFTMPLGGDEYYFGSTNEWEFDDELPTKTGREELMNGLKNLTPLPFSVKDHKAAIRPTVKDRKPFLGLHPEHPQMAIFNGLGTKGISLAPFFASHLCDFLESKTELMKEVDISRVLKK